MKGHYEEAVVTHKRKVDILKKALDKSQAHSQLLTDCIRTLFQANLEWFTTQLKAALDKGWAVANQNSDAPVHDIPPPDRDERSEPNILDILDDEQGEDGSDVPWHCPTKRAKVLMGGG